MTREEGVTRSSSFSDKKEQMDCSRRFRKLLKEDSLGTWDVFFWINRIRSNNKANSLINASKNVFREIGKGLTLGYILGRDVFRTSIWNSKADFRNEKELGKSKCKIEICPKSAGGKSVGNWFLKMHFRILSEKLETEPSECIKEAFLEEDSKMEASVGKESSRNVTLEKCLEEWDWMGKSDMVVILVNFKMDWLVDGMDILKLHLFSKPSNSEILEDNRQFKDSP
jgi:hypothetical protein